MAGLKVERYLGDGTELNRCAVRAGLDHRAIDWKASARHRKLLCQEFRPSATTGRARGRRRLMAEPVAGVRSSITRSTRRCCSAGSACAPAIASAYSRTTRRSCGLSRRAACTFHRLQALGAEIEYKRVETTTR
jgi:hypothetical protein